jgi:predicted ArsR family transcriptional regulator
MQRSSREEILTFLKLTPDSSVLSLSTALNLTKADIRYHINLLRLEGVVVQSTPRQPKGPGRPPVHFSLAPGYYADNLHEVIIEMLQFLPNKKAVLTQLAQQLINKMESTSPKKVIDQLNQLVEFLNLRDYQAHWETHRNGPAIFFMNCPYRRILQDHPDFCQMDIEMIQRALGCTVKHLQSFSEINSTKCKIQIQHFSQ